MSWYVLQESAGVIYLHDHYGLAINISSFVQCENETFADLIVFNMYN
jgi:hypothetical protein